VKHKFQYEDDGEEEEAVAVFLSSPGKTDHLSSAPTFNLTLAAAASVQSMASELELLLQEVQRNMRLDDNWDSESVKFRVGNLHSKTRLLKQFVNNELCEGKFHAGDNKYDEVDGLERTVPESREIMCSPERYITALSNSHSVPTSVSVHSDSQIVCDQFSGTGSCVEDSISIQEIVCKQDTPTHGVVRFSLAIDSSDYLLNEDDDFFDQGEEDIHTQSTSGSEVDYAIVESSSNPLAVIEEEAAAATDEDQELIPIDDIPVKRQDIDWEPDELSTCCSNTSESNSLSDQPPNFSVLGNNMALRHDGVHLIETTLDDESDTDVLKTRYLGDTGTTTIFTDKLHSYTGESKHSNAPIPSVDDGFTDFVFLETSDDDDEGNEPSVCPKIPTPNDNMLGFPDTTEERTSFKGHSQSNGLVSKTFAESSSGFHSVHSTGTVTDIEEFKSKPHEKTPTFRANELTVKDDSHKLIVHISLSQADSESHGLFCEVQSEFCTTDIEDQLTGSGFQTEPNIKETCPEISDTDGSTVKAGNVMRVQKKYKHYFPVENSQELVTDTEDLYLDGSPGCRNKKPTAKSRLMSVRGDNPSITDVKYLEVSDIEHLTQHSALIFTSKKRVDTNTDIEDMEMSEEECHKKDASIISDFVRHIDYDAVAMKGADGPLPAETQQVLSATSFGSPTIKMTSPGTEMYSGSTTDTEGIVGSAYDEAVLSCSHAETATPVDLELDIEDHLISTIHMKHTHKLNVDAPEEADHVKRSGDIQGILTDDKTLQQHHPEDHICVVDMEDQVCVCVAAENVMQDTVCICVGKHHGELTMEWNTSCGSAASHTGSWNATQEREGMGCILQLSSTTSCLPPSCIIADLSSMQVAVPHCHHPTEPAGSNPVACRCIVRTLKRT
jgi:hypothetical protein